MASTHNVLLNASPKVTVQATFDTEAIAKALIASQHGQSGREGVLRTKALELSKRILQFAVDNKPPLGSTSDITISDTPEQIRDKAKERYQRDMAISNKLSGKFIIAFDQELSSVIAKMDNLGINVSHVRFLCLQTEGSTELMKLCGLELSTMADKVPNGE